MHYAWQGAGLRRPIYDTAAACVLSPMRGGMRLTTGVELDDASAPPRAGMLQQAEAAVRQVLPLGAAIDAVLAGKPVAGPQRKSIGCSIKWK